MKNLRFIHFVSALMILFSVSASFGQAIKPAKKASSKPATKIYPTSSRGSDFVQNKEDGNINWTDQYIEAEGNSVVDTVRFKIPAQAKLMAQRGAIADAQRNLLEIVSGVLVEGTTTVENLLTQSDQLKTSVKGLLKGARQVGKTQYADGMATVRFRIPLYKKGLGDVVAEETHKEAKQADPATEADNSGQNLVLAVKGDYKPRLFPNLTDEQGNVLGNLAESLDPTNGQATKVVKQTKKAYEALKKGNTTDIMEVVQDASGNLVIADKNKAAVEKWTKWGKTIWSVVKAILI